MGAELAGVLAGNVVLVGIVLEDHQVGHAADEADLAHFLLETEEEQDAVVARDIHVLAEVAAQVGLLLAAQPAGIALAMGGDAVVQAIQDRALLFLDQKQNFHQTFILAAAPKQHGGSNLAERSTQASRLPIQRLHPEQLVPTHRLAHELVLAVSRPATPGEPALQTAAQTALERRPGLQVVHHAQGHGLVHLARALQRQRPWQQRRAFFGQRWQADPMCASPIGQRSLSCR